MLDLKFKPKGTVKNVYCIAKQAWKPDTPPKRKRHELQEASKGQAVRHKRQRVHKEPVKERKRKLGDEEGKQEPTVDSIRGRKKRKSDHKSALNEATGLREEVGERGNGNSLSTCTGGGAPKCGATTYFAIIPTEITLAIFPFVSDEGLINLALACPDLLELVIEEYRPRIKKRGVADLAGSHESGLVTCYVRGSILQEDVLFLALLYPFCALSLYADLFNFLKYHRSICKMVEKAVTTLSLTVTVFPDEQDLAVHPRVAPTVRDVFASMAVGSMKSVHFERWPISRNHPERPELSFEGTNKTHSRARRLVVDAWYISIATTFWQSLSAVDAFRPLLRNSTTEMLCLDYDEVAPFHEFPDILMPKLKFLQIISERSVFLPCRLSLHHPNLRRISTIILQPPSATQLRRNIIPPLLRSLALTPHSKWGTTGQVDLKEIEVLPGGWTPPNTIAFCEMVKSMPSAAGSVAIRHTKNAQLHVPLPDDTNSHCAAVEAGLHCTCSWAGRNNWTKRTRVKVTVNYLNASMIHYIIKLFKSFVHLEGFELVGDRWLISESEEADALEEFLGSLPHLRTATIALRKWRKGKNGVWDWESTNHD